MSVKSWLRRADPGFFERERHLVAVGTAWKSDFSADVARDRLIGADRVAGWAVAFLFMLSVVAATACGDLIATGQWPVLAPLAGLAWFLAWSTPWWRPPASDEPPPRRRTDRLMAWLARPTPLRRRLGILFPLAFLLAVVVAPLLTRIADPVFGEDRMVPVLAVASVLALLVTALILARKGAAAPLPFRLPVPVCGLALLFDLFNPSTVLGVGWRDVELSSLHFTGLASIVIAAGLFCGRRRWRLPAPWSLFVQLGAIHLWSMAYAPRLIAARLPWELGCVGLEYLLVCLIAARLAAAAKESRGRGFHLTEPQAVVPLFDRSGHDPLGIWLG